jgi:hypothetical protein
MCNNKVEMDIQRGYSYRTVTYKCGNTKPRGELILCPKCEPLYYSILANSDEPEDRRYTDY